MPKASSRIKSSLPLALLVASCQFATSALGQTVIISQDVVADRSTPTKSREHANAIPLANAFGVGVDGPGCIMPENEEGQPSQDSAPPDSSCDIEDSNADLDDVSADPSMRNDQDTPHFSVTGVGAGATHMPGIVPILLVPVHCFYCLHAHIRERAPTVPV